MLGQSQSQTQSPTLRIESLPHRSCQQHFQLPVRVKHSSQSAPLNPWHLKGDFHFNLEFWTDSTAVALGEPADRHPTSTEKRYTEAILHGLLTDDPSMVHLLLRFANILDVLRKPFTIRNHLYYHTWGQSTRLQERLRRFMSCQGRKSLRVLNEIQYVCMELVVCLHGMIMLHYEVRENGRCPFIAVLILRRFISLLIGSTDCCSFATYCIIIIFRLPIT